MSDVKLTLEPELETPAPGIPTLTLDGVEEEKPVAPEKKEEEQPEVCNFLLCAGAILHHERRACNVNFFRKVVYDLLFFRRRHENAGP